MRKRAQVKTGLAEVALSQAKKDDDQNTVFPSVADGKRSRPLNGSFSAVTVSDKYSQLIYTIVFSRLNQAI